MMLRTGLVLATSLMIGNHARLAAHAADQPSYVMEATKVAERQTVKYEIDFIARFDNRIVVDTGQSGTSVDDTIAGNGTLWDSGKAQVGRFDANTRVSERLIDGDRRLLYVTYTFGEGQDSFVTLGLGTYTGELGLMNKQSTNLFSLVGGTGIFMAAGGQCGITRLDQKNYNVKCTAFVPSY